jgi:hypothetical protein
LSDESLFREVDEEVRQEQYKKLWERYGNALIALCVIVVAGVGGYKGWQYWQVKQSETAGQNYFTALKTAAGEKPEEGLQQLAAIDHAGFKTLAQIRAGSLLAKQGKTKEALEQYSVVIGDIQAAPALRDLAAIRAAYLEADTLAPADLKARLVRFDATDSKWKNEMREIIAISAWRVKDYKMVDELTTAILGDPLAAGGIRQRATRLAGLVKPMLAAP